MHAHACTHAHTLTYACMHAHTHTLTYACTHIHICMYMHAHTHTHICMYACMHAWTCMHACMHAYACMHAWTCTHPNSAALWGSWIVVDDDMLWFTWTCSKHSCCSLASTVGAKGVVAEQGATRGQVPLLRKFHYHASSITMQVPLPNQGPHYHASSTTKCIHG